MNGTRRLCENGRNVVGSLFAPDTILSLRRGLLRHHAVAACVSSKSRRQPTSYGAFFPKVHSGILSRGASRGHYRAKKPKRRSRKNGEQSDLAEFQLGFQGPVARRGMVGIIYRTFDEPRDYERGIRLARVGDLVVSKSGVFEASLTTMTFGRVWLQSGSDSLARSLRIEIEDSRRTMLFLTDWHSVPIIQSGTNFGARDVVSFGQNTSHFQRSFGPTDWTAISLPPGDLEAAVHGFLGSDIGDPSGSLWGKPAVEHLTRLRGLRYDLSRLISSGEKTLQNPEVVRSLEQTLTAAMVACLTDRIESSRAPGGLRHQQIMRRFGDWLNANSNRAVYIKEVCTALGVSAATLRRCCEEHLRMSPMQYLWLRRMNLVRRELQQQNLRTTVTATAMNFGFWHLGRFADEYRSLFGESPSSTLARRPA